MNCPQSCSLTLSPTGRRGAASLVRPFDNPDDGLSEKLERRAVAKLLGDAKYMDLKRDLSREETIYNLELRVQSHHPKQLNRLGVRKVSRETAVKSCGKSLLCNSRIKNGELPHTRRPVIGCGEDHDGALLRKVPGRQFVGSLRGIVAKQMAPGRLHDTQSHRVQTSRVQSSFAAHSAKLRCATLMVIKEHFLEHSPRDIGLVAAEFTIASSSE